MKSIMTRMLVTVFATAGISLFAVACKSDGHHEHPKGEHPKAEHPKSEHPEAEKSGSEHPEHPE